MKSCQTGRECSSGKFSDIWDRSRHGVDMIECFRFENKWQKNVIKLLFALICWDRFVSTKPTLYFSEFWQNKRRVYTDVINTKQLVMINYRNQSYLASNMRYKCEVDVNIHFMKWNLLSCSCKEDPYKILL